MSLPDLALDNPEVSGGRIMLIEKPVTEKSPLLATDLMGKAYAQRHGTVEILLDDGTRYVVSVAEGDTLTVIAAAVGHAVHALRPKGAL